MTGDDQQIRKKLLNACLQVLIPTARFLLRGGIGCNEFLDLSRRAFVVAAARDYGTRGREANSSRIAAVTGLSRREVAKLRTSRDDIDIDARATLSPIGDLLQRWHTDESYLSEQRNPLALPIEGSAPSLESLVSEVFTTDFPVRAVRSELLRAGLAQTTEQGLILPKARQVVPTAAAERLLSALSYGLRALVETIAHNSDPNRVEPTRIERFVESPRLNQKNREFARMRMRELITQYSTDIDDQFGRLESTQHGHDDDEKRIGVGFYYYEE